MRSRTMPALLTTTSRPAERVDRELHHLARGVPVGDVVRRGDGLAAEGGDLVDHLLRRGVGRIGSVLRDTEVVHDDLGALAGELERRAPGRALAPHPVTITTRPSQIPMGRI